MSEPRDQTLHSEDYYQSDSGPESQSIFDVSSLDPNLPPLPPLDLPIQQIAEPLPIALPLLPVAIEVPLPDGGDVDVADNILRITQYFNQAIPVPFGEDDTPLLDFAELIIEHRDFPAYITEHDTIHKLLIPKVLTKKVRVIRKGATAAQNEVINLQQRYFTLPLKTLDERLSPDTYELTREQ